MFQSIEYIESRTSTGHQPITQKSIKIKRSINKIYKTPTAAATIQDRKKKKDEKEKKLETITGKEESKGKDRKKQANGGVINQNRDFIYLS